MIKQRSTFIDNIRVLLTALVIIHHTAITYGAPGGWYYIEGNESRLSVILLTLMVATNQAFFMGFFFLLSSYFIPSSMERKGERLFLLDRLKRLGIPLVFYSLVLAPVTIYLMLWLAKGASYSFMDYYWQRDNWIDFGVLWFAAALLLFTTIYWLYKKVSPQQVVMPLPGNGKLFAYAFALGFISFLVRMIFPVGWTLRPLGFQLGHFTQYIVFFAAGIIAYHNQWFEGITYKKGIQWLRVAVILLIVGFPSMYAVKEATGAPLSDFQGGVNWSSLMSCVWEQTMGVALVMTFIGIGKAKWNNDTPLLQTMARSAFAVYIIHPVVVVAATLLIKDLTLAASVKFVIASSMAIIISFLIGSLLIKVPLVNKVV